MSWATPAIVCLAGASLLAALLSGCGGQGGTSTRPADTVLPNVLLVGWDAAPRDRVRELLLQGRLPALSALTAQGALVNITVTTGATDTRAGWAEVLTGYGPDYTTMHSNVTHGEMPAGITVPERLEAAFGPGGVATAAILSKRGNMEAERPGDMYHAMSRDMDHFVNNLGDTRVVAEEAIARLRQYQPGPLFLFVLLGHADMVGHLHGEASVAFAREIVAYDEATGLLLDELSALGIAERTLVYVTSDHGFDKGERVHFHAPYVFLGTNDPAVAGPGDRKDVAPTILRRYGFDLSGFSPPLHGQPLP